MAHTPTPSHPLCPLLAPRAGIAASWGLAGQGSPRGLFRLADFAKSLRFANSISHALSHPPSSSAWAAFALSAPWVARALLGAFAGPSQGRTLYCPVTAVHLPTRRIYPLSVGSIRWIYPLDLSVGRQLPTGAASCHWHILSQQPAQLALRWSRLSTPRGGPAASPAPPSRPYPCLLRPCSLKWLLSLLALILVNSGKSHGDRQGQELAHPGRSPIPLRAHIAVCAVSQSAPLAAQGSPRGLFGLADFAKSLRFANSISHALSHPPSSSAWAAFALSTPRVARALLGAFAGPTQGRTLYCPVTAVHLPTRRIYPSAGSIRWIYPLDLSVGSIRW